MECIGIDLMRLGDLRHALKSDINSHIPKSTFKLSSILIIIHGSVPKILMTKKASHLKIHAGEVAFPGGKLEKMDSDLLHTALRETKEELGLTISESQIVGQLAPVRTLNSNFLIFPFVSVVELLPEIRCNDEVDRVLHMPIESLLKTLRNDPDHGLVEGMYTFTFGKYTIWGASARMLKQISDILHERALL